MRVSGSTLDHAAIYCSTSLHSRVSSYHESPKASWEMRQDFWESERPGRRNSCDLCQLHVWSVLRPDPVTNLVIIRSLNNPSFSQNMEKNNVFFFIISEFLHLSWKFKLEFRFLLSQYVFSQIFPLKWLHFVQIWDKNNWFLTIFTFTQVCNKELFLKKHQKSYFFFFNNSRYKSKSDFSISSHDFFEGTLWKLHLGILNKEMFLDCFGILDL